jgi:uncharacterized protein YyaL (SSP411 family)
MRAKTILNGAIRSVLCPANRSLLARACFRAIVPTRTSRTDLQDHLDATYAWLCSAQDATPDNGVAGCYNMVTGWATSYPETTGYIIPTFLHYSGAMRDPDAAQRALRMAEWETEIQLPCGAVRSGMLGAQASPAVFNTGQVLFGWLAAFMTTGDERHARSAIRACNWLTSAQDGDGAWRRHLSVLTKSSVQTYNVRAAWGKAAVGHELNEPAWIRAAVRNCDWALTQQQENGWFQHNGFADNEAPLLHTIGYALEGLLGTGLLLGREDYVDATMRGMDRLVKIYQRKGSLRGRYNARWRAAAFSRCLTGEAQIAVILLRLANVTGYTAYRRVAHRLLRNLARLHDIHSPHAESRGGVSGSSPIWGEYGPFNYINWAAKFFMDGLLLDLHKVDVQDRPSTAAMAGEACHAEGVTGI